MAEIRDASSGEGETMSGADQLVLPPGQVTRLQSFRTPDLDTIDCRRMQLWSAALVLLIVATAALATVSVWGAAPLPEWMTPFVLSCGLVGLVGLFSTYVVQQELRLRRLSRRLVREKLLTAALTSRLEETGALLEAGRAVNRELELDEVLDTILRCSLEMLDARGGSIMLAHPGDELRTVCAKGESRAHGARQSFSDGIAGRVATTREPLLIQGRVRGTSAGGVAGDPSSVSSALSVPLINRDRLLGVLNANAATGRSFTGHELRALSVFGEHAAAAIANAQLFEAQRLVARQSTYRAFHDPLTGLPNRALLLDRLASALATRRPQSRRVALLFFDLDDFKKVNDSLGHGAGDEVLVVFSDRLRTALRAGDTVSRFGGDEFAAVLRDVDSIEEPLRAAHRIQQVLDEPFEVAGERLRFSCGVGIAFEGEGASTADTLLRAGYTALHAAKAAGKRSVKVYEPRMRTDVLERLDIEQRLPGAIDRGEMVVHFQPIHSLADGRVLGLEALVRWEQPGKGLLPASAFVGIAEETGILPGIDRWVLRHACRNLREVTSAGKGPQPFLNVNLSPTTLRDGRLAEWVMDTIAEEAVEPDRVVLEVTESVMLKDAPQVAERLAELKSHGVRVALDDFGTGYCSLAYLRQLPVDMIKIDRLFIDGITHDAGTRALVGGIVRLGTGLGFDVVAEGIEDASQARTLVDVGCAYGQGFLFSRAIPAAYVGEYLATQGRLRSEAGVA